MDRVCVKDYVIQPTREGERPVHIEKGCLIQIPTAGFHYDPNFFPDPNKFDPDRFSEEKRSSIVPGSYMPFGVGPRNCIGKLTSPTDFIRVENYSFRLLYFTGSRFALLEIKVLFYHVLSKFELTVSKKSCVPIQLTREFNLTVKGGFWLGLKPRNLSV